MRKMLTLAALLPSVALAQGISRPPQIPEITIGSVWPNAALAASTLGGHVLPARGFTVTGITIYVITIGGGGAGNTVIRVSDGTNNCDATMTCAASASTGPKRATVSGTCAFAPNSLLTFSVQTAGCTTTQPTAKNIDIVGKWQ